MWLSDTERERGYAVDFLNISLHAVSRDPEAYPSPCIYAQVKFSYLGGFEIELLVLGKLGISNSVLTSKFLYSVEIKWFYAITLLK